MTDADPLSPHAAGIVDHVNRDHPGAVLEIVRHRTGRAGASAEMTSLDARGFVADVRDDAGVRSVRIAFPAPAPTPGDVRKAFVAMLKEARGGGVGPAGIEPATRRL
jgi:putative heme iron utilization protein